MARQAQMTAEAAAHFEEGIHIMISRWPALQIAIHISRDPHATQKPQQLTSQLFSLFTQSREKVYYEDVEKLMNTFTLTLSTLAQDGSVEEIATRLMFMHEECLEGNYNSIERLRESVPTYVQHIQQDDSEDDSDDEMLGNDDSSAMVVDAPETASRHFQEVKKDSPQTDDDGWTVVGGSRRNRGRRN